MLFDNPSIHREGRVFAVSAENPTGEKGGGSRGGNTEKVHPSILVAPGEQVTVLDMDGPGEIQNIWMTGSPDWTMIIRIYWENEEYPSVEAPLSAFFGYGYFGNTRDLHGNFPTLNSALILAAPCRGFNSYFLMPFRKHCRITIENRGLKVTRKIYYMITGKLGPVPEESLYFHASYRQSHPIIKGDVHTVIDGIEGKGQLLGCTLSAGINGTNGCWVEGEVKMYIDGDKYPSVNYTGTEDYFGGAYAFGYDMMGKYQQYSGLYAGMYAMFGGEILDKSNSTYNTQPRFMGYRWHLPDPIPFEHDFRMTIQNINIDSTEGITTGRYDDFSTVAYWYQTLPHKPLAPLPEPSELSLR